MAFYTPGFDYGGTSWATKNPSMPGAQAALDKGGWANTPFVKGFMDKNNNEGVFYTHLADRGFSGSDAMSQWAQALYGKALTGYKAAVRQNPAMDFRTYLRHEFSVPDVRNLYMAQGSRARGENQPAFYGRTRSIGWG